MVIKKKSAKRLASSQLRGVPALPFLERLSGGPLTLGRLLQSIREGEELSQTAFGRQLGISRAHVCDIEKGRKSVSLDRAVEFAEKLGYSKQQFVTLTIQEMLTAAGLKLRVELRQA